MDAADDEMISGPVKEYPDQRDAALAASRHGIRADFLKHGKLQRLCQVSLFTSQVKQEAFRARASSIWWVVNRSVLPFLLFRT